MATNQKKELFDANDNGASINEYLRSRIYVDVDRDQSIIRASF